MSSDSLDKFIRQYGPALAAYDQQLAQLPPTAMTSPAGMRQMFTQTQILQVHNWAAGIATGKRHSFLKKVMDEIR